jgi:beta-catenin-like protein 1
LIFFISLKSQLLQLEKKINKNQTMRLKYPDEPEKFMESEYELNTILESLLVLAASPELYPILLSTSSLTSIISLLAHENTDIAMTTIHLLQELTDTDTILEQPTMTMGIIEQLIEIKNETATALTLIIHNIQRLQEYEHEEDAQGIYHSFTLLENLIELQPNCATILCKYTPILDYLLTRLNTKIFDDNKLYASEILVQILQVNPIEHSKLLCQEMNELKASNQTIKSSSSLSLSSNLPINGLDRLLQCISIYRKKNIERLDEQECCENLFLCLCIILMDQYLHQTLFIQLEGLELLMKCFIEQQYAAGCSLSALSYALMKHSLACLHWIEIGGLKYIFAILIGKGLKKSLQKKVSGEKRNIEEDIISIISQLCLHCYLQQEEEKKEKEEKRDEHCYLQRLIMKLTENEYDKLAKICELYAKYYMKLQKSDHAFNLMKKQMQRNPHRTTVEELAKLEDEEYVYMQVTSVLHSVNIFSSISYYHIYIFI